MRLSRPTTALLWSTRHLARWAVVVAIATGFLLLTGEINDTLILLHFVTTGDDMKAVPEMLAKLGEAYTKSDWKTLGTLSAPIITRALSIYFLKSLCLIVLLSAAILLLLPAIRNAVLVLGNIPASDSVNARPANTAKSRREYGAQLRNRAARKRVESFVALIVAVLSLIICVAFVSRSEPQFESETLQTYIPDVRESLSDAKLAFSSAISEANASAVSAVLAAPEVPASAPPAGKRRLDAEAKTQEAQAQQFQVSSASVLVQQARLHMAVANDQLSMIERLASQEALMRIIALASAKFGAVLLVLVLVRYLYKQYALSNSLVVSYDALADAVELEDVVLPKDLQSAREALNPLGGRTDDAPDAPAESGRETDAVLEFKTGLKEWLDRGLALVRKQ